jgi:hypothetical protein
LDVGKALGKVFDAPTMCLLATIGKRHWLSSFYSSPFSWTYGTRYFCSFDLLCLSEVTLAVDLFEGKKTRKKPSVLTRPLATCLHCGFLFALLEMTYYFQFMTTWMS